MRAVVASIGMMTGVLTNSLAMAQMDSGPKTEKTFGIGLPRDHAAQLFSDKDYPVFPLKPGQEAYKDIDGVRMKKDVVALSQIGTPSTSSGGAAFPAPTPTGLA